MWKKTYLLLLLLSQLCAASTSRDTVFVVSRATDTSYHDILYYRTNNTSRKIYEFTTGDDSELSYLYRHKDSILDYDCVSWYNNAGGCQQYIFLDRKTKTFYITKHCFEMFKIDKRSVNFKNKTVVLYGFISEPNGKVISDGRNEKIENITASDSTFNLYHDKGKRRVLDKLILFPDGFRLYE